jgi:hypothetical protein
MLAPNWSYKSYEVLVVSKFQGLIGDNVNSGARSVVSVRMLLDRPGNSGKHYVTADDIQRASRGPRTRTG